jgi:hypothetical protein
MAPESRNEVAEHLTALYTRTPVGGDIWVRPDDTTTLRKFQIVAAAAQALERLGRIQIIETHEGDEGAARLIDGIHIRRLK